jgi:hypothetical protein
MIETVIYLPETSKIISFDAKKLIYLIKTYKKTVVAS